MKVWKLFLAYFRFSKTAVCEMSEGKDKYSCFHDYPDGTIKIPMHFHTYNCERCNKEFII